MSKVISARATLHIAIVNRYNANAKRYNAIVNVNIAIVMAYIAIVSINIVNVFNNRAVYLNTLTMLRLFFENYLKYQHYQSTLLKMMPIGMRYKCRFQL